jgi:hypothetical protein
VVTICTTCCNIQKLCILLCFARATKQTTTVSLNSIRLFISVVEKECVSCEVRTEFLYILTRNPVFKGLNRCGFIKTERNKTEKNLRSRNIYCYYYYYYYYYYHHYYYGLLKTIENLDKTMIEKLRRIQTERERGNLRKLERNWKILRKLHTLH